MNLSVEERVTSPIAKNVGEARHAVQTNPKHHEAESNPRYSSISENKTDPSKQLADSHGDYDSYVASLKREHGQYESKLRQLQEKIQSLNSYAKSKPTGHKPAQDTGADLVRRSGEIRRSGYGGATAQEAMVSSECSKQEDDAMFSRDAGRALDPSSTSIDLSKYRQVPPYKLQTRKMQDYDIQPAMAEDSF